MDETTHSIGAQDGVPYTKLTVSKPKQCSVRLNKINNDVTLFVTRCQELSQEGNVHALIRNLRAIGEKYPNLKELITNDEASDRCILRLDTISDKANEMIVRKRIEEALEELPDDDCSASGKDNMHNNSLPQSAVTLRRDVLQPPKRPPKPAVSPEIMAKLRLTLTPEKPMSLRNDSNNTGTVNFTDDCNSCNSSHSSRNNSSIEINGEEPNEEENEDANIELCSTLVPPPVVQSHQDAVEESIFTEERYLRRLKLLTNHYYVNFKTLPVSDKFKLNSLFGSFENMIPFNEMLLQTFYEVRDNYKSGKSSHYTYGKEWAQYIPMLKIYKDYFNSYEGNLPKYYDLLTLPDFKQLSQELQQQCPDPSDKGIPFTSHLLEPIQRIPRYPLLLDRYIKEIGPDHPDYADAKKSLESIKIIADDLNNTIRETEKSQKAFNVLSDISMSEDLKEKAWGKEKHVVLNTYICSENVIKISSKNVEQQRFLILFNSILIVCKNKHGHYIMAMDKTFSCTLDDKLNADYDNCLRLKNKKNTMDISFESAERRDKWIEIFKSLNMQFITSNEKDDKFPWEAFEINELGVKRPMKLKDKDVSQCQACTKSFTAIHRRHHCRFCGGIFCNGCSKYEGKPEFSNKEERCCFYCRNRLDMRDALMSNTQRICNLSKEHMEVIERNKEWERKYAETVDSGYFEVKFEIVKPQMKADTPDYVCDNWYRMWCTIDKDNVLNIFRMKNDSKVATKVVLPLSKCWKCLETQTDIQKETEEIVIDEAGARICHFRLPQSSVKGASNDLLNHWYEIISVCSQSITR